MESLLRNLKINALWKNSPGKGYIYLSVTIIFLTAALILGLRSSLPPEVPLFYGKPQGQEQLAPTLSLLTAPATALVFVIFNTLLSFFLKDILLKKILIISTLFVSALAAITVIKIIFLVGLF